MDYQYISINIILPVPFLIWGPGEQTKVARPFRAAPERQRGFREEADAAQVPAKRSGDACPTGAVAAMRLGVD